MGNVLTASNPTELLSLQAYVNNGSSVESLGSTRFMKVARSNSSNEGSQVKKVFVHTDDNLNLEPYINEIYRIRQALSACPNCCTFKKIDRYSRYCIISRPYQKYTLYERLSTRPFTVRIERHWYIYQLLRALVQCEENGVCHGDLKSQNVLVSSSMWVQIADFASYKPTFLPEDNPSVFTYFFDSSRRQSCYIAPERILSSADYDPFNRDIAPDTPPIFQGLTTSMDLFSAGCVIFELLNDGRPPFTYGELVSYRNMNDNDAERYMRQLLSSSGEFIPLLARLLSKRPELRQSASSVLSDFSHLFPEMFNFLFNYLNAFRPKELSSSLSVEDFGENNHTQSMEADDVIAKLYHDEVSIFDRFKTGTYSPEATVFFMGLITSNLRTIRSPSTRVLAMQFLIRLCELCSPTVSIQRVLPYLVSQLNERDVVVRACAVTTICDLVSPILPETVEDSLIFIDYLLPKFEAMSTEKNVPTYVLLALAKNIGRIAAAAMRFTEARRVLRSEKKDEEMGMTAQSHAEQQLEERSTLSKQMCELFVALSSRDDPVRVCLASPPVVLSLHTFFTQYGQSDLLLRHMITLLNVKSDWRIRASFFDCLPIIVGTRSIDVRSLIEQGLHDVEDAVVVRALACVRHLAVGGLLDQMALFEMVETTMPFLSHPNEWIRSACVDLAATLDGKWSLADVHCRLLPHVTPHLTRPLIRLNRKTVIMDCLVAPIPKEIWSKVVRLNQEMTSRLCNVLVEGSISLNETRPISDAKIRMIFENSLNDRSIFNRLKLFSKLLVKMADFRTTQAMEKRQQLEGHVNLCAVDKSCLKEEPLAPSKSESQTVESFSRLNVSGDGIGASVMDLLDVKRREWASKWAGRAAAPPTGDHVIENLTGTLITHIHEHTARVTQLSCLSDGSRVLSVSADGTLKLWSGSQLTGETYGAVRADVTYDVDKKCPLSGGGWIGDQKVIVSSKGGMIVLFDCLTSVREITKVRVSELDGWIEQLIVSGPVVYVRTHHGVFYCLDTRVGHSTGTLGKHEVWRRQVEQKKAKMNSFCIDKQSDRWMAFTGTDHNISLWDLRLVMEVSSWKCPMEKGVPMKLWSSEYSHAESPEVFVGSSVCGELSLINLASRSRSAVFWPSFRREPFNYSQEAGVKDYDKMTCALAVGAGGWAVVGDSRGEIRRWNYRGAPPYGTYLSGFALLENCRIGYELRQRQKDGNSVVVTYEKSVTDRGYLPPSSPHATTCHRTSISDLLCLPQGLLLSSSIDGSIKVWR